MPRRVRPGATYAICRRVEGRRLLLRPDAMLTRLFTFLLCVLAERLDIEIHVAVVMSTHFHLVVTDPHGRISVFMERLDGLLSKSIKVCRRYVQGVVWEPGGLSIVELKTLEAIVEQIAYAIANPVKAGLVTDPAHWPGLTATIEDLGARTLGADRPSFFFRPVRWPSRGSLRLTLPSCLAGLGRETALELVRRELARQVTEARREVRSKRWRVLGPIAAKSVSPYRRATSYRALGTLNPHIAAGRGQTHARIAALRELVEFRRAYRVALARWLGCDREVVFPAGTYWMRVHHGARVAAFAT